MTENVNEQELEFQSYEISDSFSQTIEEEVKAAAQALVEENEELTEEDIASFGEPFNAAVRGTVKRLLAEEVVPHYEGQLQNLVEEVQEKLQQDVSDYLEFVVEDFVEQNKSKLVASQTAEQDRTLVEGLIDLLQKHYVEVPEGRKDLVEEMSSELSAARSEIESLEEELINARRMVKGSRCERIVNTLSEQLESDAQREKFMSLVEDLEIDDVALFEEKATSIHSALFKGNKASEENSLNEEQEETLEEELIEEGGQNIAPNVPDYIAEAVRLGSVAKRSGFPRRNQ